MIQRLPFKVESLKDIEGLEDEVDHEVVFRDVPWQVYEALLEARGPSRRPRMVYLKGELTLVTTSSRHEWLKKAIARLLEAYATERDLEFNGFGSYTIIDPVRKVGLEPDECYVIDAPRAERPHIAIEVVLTSGGPRKLAAYAALAVEEVWMWRKGTIEIYGLDPEGDGYAPRPRSRYLPDLDPAWLVTFLDYESQSAAVRAMLAALRGAA